jgi:hypothetical protein
MEAPARLEPETHSTWLAPSDIMIYNNVQQNSKARNLSRERCHSPP